MTEPLPTAPSVLQPAPALEPVAPRSRRSRIGAHLRTSFITGLITLIPLFITLYLLMILFGFATGLTKPLAKAIVPAIVKNVAEQPPENNVVAVKAYNDLLAEITDWTSPILALIITVLVIYALGVLSIFTIGRRLLAAFEHFIENLPLIKGIYGTTKQVITVFRQGGGGSGFQRVVLVEFPRAGTWTIAFVTNVINDGPDTRLVCCFIPMTPNPTSGFFQMFKEAEVRNTDWSVDTGIKIILSGGLLAPRDLPGDKSDKLIG